MEVTPVNWEREGWVLRDERVSLILPGVFLFEGLDGDPAAEPGIEDVPQRIPYQVPG